MNPGWRYSVPCRAGWSVQRETANRTGMAVLWKQFFPNSQVETDCIHHSKGIALSWLARWFWVVCIAVALPWTGDARAQTGTAIPRTTQQPPSNPVPSPGISAPAPTPAADQNGRENPSRATELPKGVVGDIIYLPGPDRELVPVPAGASLRGYLDWLQKKRGVGPEAATDVPLPAASPPKFDITSIALEGSADEDRARLTARIRIQLSRQDEWTRVPLELSEAVLRGYSYKGSGESLPDRQAESGDFSWWFRGKGDHELTLELSVPVKQSPRRRLQLSLPPTVVSSLKLWVPQAKAQVRVGERGAISVRDVGAGSEIEIFGIKEDLDLSWQAAPSTESGAAVLETSTAILVNLTEGEPSTLTATQKVQALQGKFAELSVELPEGFDLEKIDGEEVLDHRNDPKKPRTTLVRLKQPTAGPVELQWSLRGRHPAENVPFTISGFDVRDSRVKDGFIVLQVVGDFQLSRNSSEERHVRRINAGDLPKELRTSSATAQYRFLAQPFRFVFSLQKVEPFVTVDPMMFLAFSADQVELEASFSFYISRGTMSTVDLFWPKLAEENWTAISVGPLELVEPLELKRETGQIRVRLLSPTKERCQIRLRARRPITPIPPRVAAGTDSLKSTELPPLQLSLPYSRVSSTSSMLLAAFLADNVDLDLRGITGTALRPLPTPLSKASVPRDMISWRRLDYRLESGPPNLLAGVTRYTRKIVTETDAAVTSNRGELSVRQRIIYDVAYDRLTQLRLKLPPGLPLQEVKLFSDKGGVAIDPTVRRGDDTTAELICPLDAPRSGRIEIEARYRLAISQKRVEGVQTVSIPLLTSLDAPFSGTRFVWQDPAGREATLSGEAWTRQPATDGLPTWVRAGNTSSIAMTLSRSANHALRGTVISRGLLRSVVDAEGRIETRAQYRVASLSGPLTVAFSEGVQPTAFWWNRQQIMTYVVAGAGDGTRVYELPPPDRSTIKDHLLSIDYHSIPETEQRNDGVTAFPAPRFQAETWLNSVLWEVCLPTNEHLLQRPAGVSPEYRWTWTEYSFSRKSTLGPKALTDWIGEEDGPDPFLVGMGNNYLFSQSGPVPEITLRTMSQSAIVLVGAGLALAAGFVLVRIPATRHAVSLLAVLFAMAAAGLWFPEPVLLLLQPAGIGLVLAVAAAWGESLRRRRRDKGGITLVPQSGYQLPTLPGSSIEREHLPAIGTEEFTVNRPAPDESSIDQFRSSVSERSA